MSIHRIEVSAHMSIERDLRDSHRNPGLYVLTIGTSAYGYGFKYELLPAFNQDSVIKDLAFFYNLSEEAPVCSDLLPLDWQKEARIDRWLVMFTDDRRLKTLDLLATEYLQDEPWVKFESSELNDLMKRAPAGPRF